ncbi:hypothetical protein BBH99_07050 [Chryseobacterium contaminans]|uniref:Redox-active disulfide protein 2 n=1 Tax=Chryseobacterium contaminans TaxID=1423959 RepID=A0A1M6V8F3_9FLAO|nr:hypothetical protein [Chryseobacterium contaminans]OCA78976.1 hypothetical protein BBH99_07050 [Chryseobacterium contaminans]SHK77770.1 hypothetical protein SAMN05444407_101114 [Chryseobacterium contaminans]
MKKNIYEILTDEELIKKRNTLKGVSVGFGVVFALGIIAFISILVIKGAKGFPFVAFTPFIVMPVTMIPLLINLNLANKEIKSRNL